MERQKAKRRWLVVALVIALIGIGLYVSTRPLLVAAGLYLVLDDAPQRADAIVVLSTGVEYYPRLIEAAALFGQGYGEKVIINGNRKTESLRELERKGFVPACPWYEDSLRILSLLGVPRDRVVTVSAEDAYDTVSEAEAVSKALLQTGIQQILITTSRYHTRRARTIWKDSLPRGFSVKTVAARTDPFDPQAWWREGRQIRWVLAEYGGWIYYYWKKLFSLR